MKPPTGERRLSNLVTLVHINIGRLPFRHICVRVPGKFIPGHARELSYEARTYWWKSPGRRTVGPNPQNVAKIPK